jgi:hypothetical protein
VLVSESPTLSIISQILDATYLVATHSSTGYVVSDLETHGEQTYLRMSQKRLFLRPRASGGRVLCVPAFTFILPGPTRPGDSRPSRSHPALLNFIV